MCLQQLLPTRMVIPTAGAAAFSRTAAQLPNVYEGQCMSVGHESDGPTLCFNYYSKLSSSPTFIFTTGERL